MEEAAAAAAAAAAAGEDGPPMLEMKNYLKVTRTITVGVYNSDRIDNVKAKFCEMESIAANLQNILFTGNHLKHNRALDYDLQDGSSVHMVLHSSATMKIHVKASWSGKTVALDVLSWDTIQNIKAKFQDQEGTPTNKLALIHNGKQLEDSQTLAASNIQSGSTLYAVFCGGDRIEISVRTPAQERFKIEVKLWYTIENVKTVIESMAGVLANRQTLTFAGEELVNDRILASYKNIKTESVLHLTIDMQIFVRSLNGKTITIDVKSSDTIKDVKKKISTKENIPWDKQMLLFERKHLGNNVTLADCNIQRDSTLILSLLRCYC